MYKNLECSTPIEIDETIFSEMVSYYIDVYGLPPLAAKIYSYLNFDFSNIGVTFDELLGIFKSSKSSISCNLQLLISQNLVLYEVKENTRKRLFYLNQDYIKLRFEQVIERMERELSFVEKLREFKKCPSDNIKIVLYKNLLQDNIDNIKKTLKEI